MDTLSSSVSSLKVPNLRRNSAELYHFKNPYTSSSSNFNFPSHHLFPISNKTNSFTHNNKSYIPTTVPSLSSKHPPLKQTSPRLQTAHCRAASGYAAALVDIAKNNNSLETLERDVSRLSKWLRNGPFLHFNYSLYSFVLVVPPARVPKWVAPQEVYDNDINELSNYTTKSDIWLVGITALELAYGDIRASNRDELLRMIKKIKKSKRLPDRLEDLLVKKGKMKKVASFIKNKLKLGKKGKFSEEFEYVVLKCLEREGSKRPTVDELLTFPFFQNAKGLNYFRQTVLQPLLVDD